MAFVLSNAAMSCVNNKGMTTDNDLYDAESFGHSVLGVHRHTAVEKYRDISDNDMKRFYAAVYSHRHNDKVEESRAKSLLHNNDSYEKLYNYVFK